MTKLKTNGVTCDCLAAQRVRTNPPLMAARCLTRLIASTRWSSSRQALTAVHPVRPMSYCQYIRDTPRGGAENCLLHCLI